MGMAIVVCWGFMGSRVHWWIRMKMVVLDGVVDEDGEMSASERAREMEERCQGFL